MKPKLGMQPDRNQLLVILSCLMSEVIVVLKRIIQQNQ